MWLKKEDFTKRMAIKKKIENREIATRFQQFSWHTLA